MIDTYQTESKGGVLISLSQPVGIARLLKFVTNGHCDT